MELLNFIGNEFVAAANGKTFTKFSPFNGEALAQVSCSDAMDFIRALQNAKKAAATFKNTSLEDRAELLEKFARHLHDHTAEISYQEALHQGLPASFVKEVSIDYSIQLLEKTVKELRNYSSANEVLAPVGVLGIITSWAGSLKLVMERLIPAIASGNAVLIKVSELSPITAKILGEAVLASGIPIGVVQVLQGGSDIGELMAGHPGIRAIAAVGKPTTIEAIAKIGSAQLKKLQLSGGAKNACIVLADADFESQMPEILKSYLIGQGQMCWNTSRLFIPEAVAPAFMEKAKAFISDLKPLKDPNGSEMWTPLIENSRLEKIKSTTQQGIEEHGKLVAGGECLSEGNFARPSLMLDLPQCSVFQQDEVAGPLILVTPVKYQHEAVKWTNTSYLAHSAVVWGSQEKAAKVAGQLEVSYAWTNAWIGTDTPCILGQKQSFFGNPDISWNGSFYSDVKKLAGA